MGWDLRRLTLQVVPPTCTLLLCSCYSLQILAQCPGLPLTSLGCPWEDGQKMGSQHQDIQSLSQRRARRMSCPHKCTR